MPANWGFLNIIITPAIATGDSIINPCGPVITTVMPVGPAYLPVFYPLIPANLPVFGPKMTVFNLKYTVLSPN